MYAYVHVGTVGEGWTKPGRLSEKESLRVFVGTYHFFIGTYEILLGTYFYLIFFNDLWNRYHLEMENSIF